MLWFFNNENVSTQHYSAVLIYSSGIYSYIVSSNDTKGLQRKKSVIQTKYRPFFFKIQTKWRPIFTILSKNTDQHYFVSPFLDQIVNIFKSRGRDLQGCLLWKACFNLLIIGLRILTYSMNKALALVHSYVMIDRGQTYKNNATILSF